MHAHARACTRKRVSEQERKQTGELEKMHRSRHTQIFKQIFKNDAIEKIQPHQQCAQEYCDKCMYAYLHTRIIQKSVRLHRNSFNYTDVCVYVCVYLWIHPQIHTYKHIYP